MRKEYPQLPLLYYILGSARKCARLYNVTPQAICNALKKAGIKYENRRKRTV